MGIQWHGDRKLRAHSLGSSRGSLYRFGIELDVTGVFRTRIGIGLSGIAVIRQSQDWLCGARTSHRPDDVVELLLVDHSAHDVECVLEIYRQDCAVARIHLDPALQSRQKSWHGDFYGVFTAKQVWNGE